MYPSLLNNTRSVNKLREACAIIDGIPAGNVWLAKWETKGVKNGNLTKAILCPGLWLLLHPTFSEIQDTLFNAMYLEQRVEDKTPVFQTAGERLYGSLLLAKVLKISPQEAASLFRPITTTELQKGLPDKVLWRQRAINLIKKLEKVATSSAYVPAVKVKEELSPETQPSASSAFRTAIANFEQYNLAA